MFSNKCPIVKCFQLNNRLLIPSQSFLLLRSELLLSYQYHHILFDKVQRAPAPKRKLRILFLAIEMRHTNQGSRFFFFLFFFFFFFFYFFPFFFFIFFFFFKFLIFFFFLGGGAHSTSIICQTKMTIYFRIQPFCVLSKRKLSLFIQRFLRSQHKTGYT